MLVFCTSLALLWLMLSVGLKYADEYEATRVRDPEAKKKFFDALRDLGIASWLGIGDDG